MSGGNTMEANLSKFHAQLTASTDVGSKYENTFCLRRFVGARVFDLSIKTSFNNDSSQLSIRTFRPVAMAEAN